MSLRAFHIFFILASIVLSFGFGLWARRTGESGIMTVAAYGIGAALCGYLVWFLKKKKPS